MNWIHHNGDLFNLNDFSHICRVGEYDISLSKALSPDDDDYYVLIYENEELRDEAFLQIKSMLFSRNI